MEQHGVPSRTSPIQSAETMNTSPVVRLVTWNILQKRPPRIGQPMQAVGELLQWIHGAKVNCTPDALQHLRKQHGWCPNFNVRVQKESAPR
jgi:hypothetical protein